MEETFSIVSQEIYRTRQIDISNNPECKKLFRKIANKYLDKYKNHKNDDIESCKKDIVNYSIKYFYKKVHGKPPGKVGDLKQYSTAEAVKDESTIPVPTERDIIDSKQQAAITKKKDEIYRNLFSSDIRKVIFSVAATQNSSLTYDINLQDKNIVSLKNLININIIKASIPLTYYNINSSNKSELDSFSGVTLSAGFYTTNTLPTINNITSHSDSTGKFTFNGTMTATNKSLAKVLGLGTSDNITYTSASPVISDVRGTSFVDIEIEEIPSIVCNHTEYSDNVISRIPFTSGVFGSIINYSANPANLIHENFYPISLTKLTINPLDEFGTKIDFNGVSCHFTFEAVILKNVPDMGMVVEN